jgi:hypothetical protein
MLDMTPATKVAKAKKLFKQHFVLALLFVLVAVEYYLHFFMGTF